MPHQPYYNVKEPYQVATPPPPPPSQGRPVRKPVQSHNSSPSFDFNEPVKPLQPLLRPQHQQRTQQAAAVLQLERSGHPERPSQRPAGASAPALAMPDAPDYNGNLLAPAISLPTNSSADRSATSLSLNAERSPDSTYTGSSHSSSEGSSMFGQMPHVPAARANQSPSTALLNPRHSRKDSELSYSSKKSQVSMASQDSIVYAASSSSTGGDPLTPMQTSNAQGVPALAPPSNNAPYGVGCGSSYVKALRRKTGTVCADPKVALQLPIAIQTTGDGKPVGMSQAYLKRAMAYRPEHLAPRLLASEFEDNLGAAAFNDHDKTAGAEHADAKEKSESDLGRKDSVRSIRSVQESMGKIKLFVANPDTD